MRRTHIASIRSARPGVQRQHALHFTSVTIPGNESTSEALGAWPRVPLTELSFRVLSTSEENMESQLRPTRRWFSAHSAVALPLLFAAVAFVCGESAAAQTAGGSNLPATPPTNAMQPLSGTGVPRGDSTGAHPHRAQVSCADGQITIHANNASLNGILRSISRCTGMRITGGVADQRVFGNYGPAAPATVLATLLDGTGSNMVLRETATAQPAELELTPRTVGVTPPSPSMVTNDEVDEVDTDTVANAPGAAGGSGGAPGNAPARSASGSAYSSVPAGGGVPQRADQTPDPGTDQSGTPASASGSTLTGPVSMPQPINNVNGSASNVSPTASTYPTTNSVPLDSLPTPSTTPSANGIVDAPNPPAPGSDTAHLLQGIQGSGATVPGNSTLTTLPTGTATDPGATNTTTPVPAANPNNGAGAPAPANGPLTPEQVYQQLQQIRRQQQQGQAPTTPPPS